MPFKDSVIHHVGSLSHSAAPHTASTQHEDPPPFRRGRRDLLTAEDSELHARTEGEKEGACRASEQPALGRQDALPLLRPAQGK